MKKQPKNTLSETLKSTCAAAAVATCWGIGQQAEAQILIGPEDEHRLGVSSSTGLTDLFLIYGNASSGFISTSDLVFEPLPDAPNGNLTQDIFLFEPDLGELTYTVIGRYSDPSNLDLNEQSGVALGIEFSQTIIGQEFSDLFTFPESDILTALENNDLSTLGNFFVEAHDNNLVVFGETGSVINFSAANNVGTVNFAPVPEPGAFVLLITGAMFTALRRKRS